MSMHKPSHFLRPAPIQVHPTTTSHSPPQQSRRPSQSQSAQPYQYQPTYAAFPQQPHSAHVITSSPGQQYAVQPNSASPYVPHPSPPPPTHHVLHPSAVQSHSQRSSLAGSVSSSPQPALQRMLSELDTSTSLEASADAPTVTKAIHYRNSSCPRQHKTQMWTLGTLTDEELMKYGVGTRLYFQQLRRLGWVFFIMFLFAVPSFMFNVKGNGVNTGYVLTKLTLGNQGVANTTSTTNSTSSSSSSDSLVTDDTIYGYDKEVIGLVISLCDLAATLVFLLSLLKAALDHRRVTAEYHSSILTVSRYSVAVTNLPKHATDRMSLKQHFSQFGPVVDVSILYSNFALVELYVERGRQRKLLADAEHHLYQQQHGGSLNNRQHAEKVVEDFQKKVATIDHQIAVERAMVGTWPVTAYVTFEQQTDSDKCLRHYIDNFWYWLLLPVHLRYQGKRVRVRRAPEPSNILYHNLSYTANAKRLRRVLTLIVSIALISVTTAVVYVAQYVHNNKIPQVVGCDGTDKVNDANFDLVLAYESNADGSYTDEINCYCSQLSLSSLIVDQQYCTEYIKSYALNNALILLTAFTTIATNVLIQYAVTKISQFERHTSRSSQQLTMARKLSTGLILNTGIIIVLVNADLSALLDPIGLSAISNSSGYSDLTTYWYNSVGSSVTITMFIGIFNPACLQLVAILIDYFKRAKFLQLLAPTYNHNNNTHNPMADIKNQDELNRTFQGRAFTLDVRYSHLLVTVCICYMYSGGIPIMLLIASMSLFVTYYCDKLSFCHLYRIPPRYDEHLDSFALHALPIAALLHSVMNVGYYSSIVMESYTISSTVTGYFDYQNLVDQYGINHIPFDVSDRLNQYNVLPFVILTVVLLLFYLARPIIAVLSLLPCIPNERKDPLALILPNYFGELGSRPSYYDAVRRVKLESYRLSRQQHWRLAYLVTGSRKQMEKDEEFESVGEKLRDIKREKGWSKGVEDSETYGGYGVDRGSVSVLAGPMHSMQYSAGQPLMAWHAAGSAVAGGKADYTNAQQSHARMVSSSYLSPYSEDTTREPSHSRAASSVYRPPSPERRKPSVQLPNVVELDEVSSPPPYSPPPPRQHLQPPSQHSRSASSTPQQQQPWLIVMQRSAGGAAASQDGLVLVGHKHSYSDASQLQRSQPNSVRASPAAPVYRSMPADSSYPISRTQPQPTTHFHTASAPAYGTMQLSPASPSPRPLAITVPPPGATYPNTPLSPTSPMSPTAKAASAKLLSTLSLGDLTQMSQQSLALLWAQYASSPSADRLKRRQIKQLAVDCVDRVLQQLTNDLRRLHSEWGEREVREAVRKELKFVIAGVKEGDGMEEMARAMAGRLVRKLDVNGDGEISRTELLVSWNAFSSELFTMKKEQSDGSLDCCIM